MKIKGTIITIILFAVLTIIQSCISTTDNKNDNKISGNNLSTNALNRINNPELFLQTKCKIQNYYTDFIKIKKVKFGFQEYLQKQIIVPNQKQYFSELIEKNNLYIDYLLTNFSSNANYDDLLKINDSIVLQMTFIKSLQADTIFNSVITELVSKTVENTKLKDTITIDGLLNIAVKFFSIIRINNEGNYVGIVCTGQNDIKMTEKRRQPQLEAFCLSTILSNYEGGKINLYDEFVKSMKELYKINLGIDKNERLLRAQGAMFILMKNNEILKNILINEYNKNMKNLPFILKEK